MKDNYYDQYNALAACKASASSADNHSTDYPVKREAWAKVYCRVVKATLFWAGMLLATNTIHSQEIVATDPNSINACEVFGANQNELDWTAGTGNCSTEFRQNVDISYISWVSQSSPANPSPTENIFANCSASIPNVVRDNGYAYYSDKNAGRLYKKAVNLTSADPATEIVTPYTPVPAGSSIGAVTLWNGVLYWAYSSSVEAYLFGVNPDGTNPQYLGQATGSGITKISGFSYDSGSNGIVMLSGGVLTRFNLTSSGTVFDTLQLATAVQDFAIRNEAHSAF